MMRLFAASAVVAIAAAASAPGAATNLLTEYVENPIVIDTSIGSPRFFWMVNHADRGITQQSYRIMVNSTTAGTSVWDSGVVVSNSTTQIVYDGQALQSDSVYTWAVQWTDSNGAVAPWSSVAKFGTGLLTQAEWTSAWIGCPLNSNPPATPNYNQIRGEVNLNLAAGVTITQARLYITGIGYYNVRVNGDWAHQWSGPSDFTRPRLDPGWTTYEVRSLYNAYDLSSTLVPNGPNAIAIMVGNGWPDITPVPGNSSSDEEDAVMTADALIARRLAGITGREGKDLTDNTGALRQTRFQLHVRTSDGNTQVFTSTAGAFDHHHAAVDTKMIKVKGSGKGKKAAAPVQWMCGAGSLQYDNVYNGCTWDATQYTTGWDMPGYSYTGAGNWTQAVLRADPGGATPTTMTAQGFPAISVQSAVPAQTMWSPIPGMYVFDFGQNLAGFVRLSLPAPVPAGAVITIRHAETVMHPPYGPKDGTLYYGNLRSAKATDVYTTAGTDATGADSEVFEPVFTYHGFRYIAITGLPFPPTLDMVTALFIRSGVPHAGNVVFPPSANVLNQLQHAVTWGIGNNLMAVVSDCPQRDERKGWMGDSGLSLVPTHYNYNMGAFYTFWAMNIRDSQLYTRDSHPTGSVPDTVPHTFGDYPSDPAWGTAYPGVVHSTWRFYGDTRIAADHYPNLQSYIAFMTQRTNSTGPGHIYQSYGDWCPPPPQLNGGQGPKPPTGYTSALAFLVDLQRITELATALGKTSDAAAYASYRQWVIDGFNTAFLNSTSGFYGNQNGDGLQTANAGAIGVGAASSAGAAAMTNIGQALINDIVVTHDSHWVTGIIGMRYLHGALTSIGAGNVAVDTLLQVTYPSYGFEFNHPDEPATTLWELPDGPYEGPSMNSRNHHMFASVGGWLYEDIAGIGQVRSTDSTFNAADATQQGFSRAVIFPRVTSHPNVSFIEAEYASIAGRYTVTWENGNSSSGASTCSLQAPENEVYSFNCPLGGIFTGVVFASFGTANGVCGSFTKGSCDAANSTAIVSAACLGKTNCSIDVSDTLFGDPCYDTVKYLDAQLTCSKQADLSIAVSIPANTQATVRIPFPAATNAAGIQIEETGSGNAAPVFAGGKFVPGVTGVYAGAINTMATDSPAGQFTVDLLVGSGSYTFAAAASN